MKLYFIIMDVTQLSTNVVSEEVLAGTEIPGGRRRRKLYLSLHCHHRNDFCVNMGSEETHFNQVK